MLFIKREHWQKAVTTMRVCFSTAVVIYWNETWRRQSIVFVDTCVKAIKVDDKWFIWNFFGNLLIKRMVQWNIWTACTVMCFKNSEIKSYRHCQHDEFVTAFARLSRFIYDNRVVVVLNVWENAGNFFQYSVRPCQHLGDRKRWNGKRETVEKWH